MKCFCHSEMNHKMINTTSFFECPSCGYLMKECIVSAEDEKARYDEHICDAGYLEYMHKVYDRIQPFLGKNCLDFGCGKIHALADILKENNYESSFYDLYYYPVLPKGKFDSIILIEVFEHIQDSLGILEKLKEMLSPNGSIIIMTMVKREPLEKWWYLRDSTHIRFVENKTMEKLAELLKMKIKIDKDLFIFES